MLDLAQLLRVPQVHPQFDISPDDLKLAFAWNKTGGWQIYEIDLDTSSAPRPVTVGISGKLNPRYSPDGTRLAYVLDIDGGESYHLVVFDFATSQHKDLTPNISHALQPNFCWSPDGDRLAFLSDQHGHFSAYIIPANRGDSRCPASDKLVELGLSSAGTVQLGHFYGFSVNVYGFSTNAHTLDAQNAFERGLNATIPALAGADELSGIGEMEAGVMGSYAQTSQGRRTGID
jgi:dipeptidyl aminopeptidase/acylaminoacyl peptidase